MVGVEVPCRPAARSVAKPKAQTTAKESGAQAARPERIPQKWRAATLAREARQVALGELHSGTRRAVDLVPEVATWVASEGREEAPGEVVEQRHWGHLRREPALILAVVQTAV